MKTGIIVTLLLIFTSFVSGYYHEKDIINELKETGKCTTACWTNNIIMGEVISK